jgi:hypothetical protein
MANDNEFSSKYAERNWPGILGPEGFTTFGHAGYSDS